MNRARTITAAALLPAALLFAACGQDSAPENTDKKDATAAAQKYVQATGQDQCRMTHPDNDGAARNCEDSPADPVWPDHPTKVTEAETWKDGYAITIPDDDGQKDVFGMRKDGDAWKVSNFDIIDDSDESADDPACTALSQDEGEDC